LLCRLVDICLAICGFEVHGSEIRLNRRGRAMQDFIFEANIADDKKLLATEMDDSKIAMLRKLLTEEKAKLTDFHSKKQRSNAAE